MFTGRGTLGRGLQMLADERQVRQEQSSPKRPVAVVQPPPGDEVGIRRQEPTSAPFGRGITRRSQQVAQSSERSDTVTTTSETGSQVSSASFGRGIARRPQQVAQSSERSDTVTTTLETGSQLPSASFGRGMRRTVSTSESEMEVSAASSQSGRRATTLEDKLRRIDMSDQLVEEKGTYGEE